MKTTFLLTADGQVGKPFALVDDVQKRSPIEQERIHVLRRAAEAAKIHEVEFIVVACGLFDSPTANKATVSAACARNWSKQLPVFVIPANRDQCGPGSLGLEANLHFL